MLKNKVKEQKEYEDKILSSNKSKNEYLADTLWKKFIIPTLHKCAKNDYKDVNLEIDINLSLQEHLRNDPLFRKIWSSYSLCLPCIEIGNLLVDKSESEGLVTTLYDKTRYTEDKSYTNTYISIGLE